MRAKGFFCNVDVLYGGLGIGKLWFFIQKYFFSAVIFILFLVMKTLDPDWIRIGIQPKMLDPDQMNADPTVAYHVHCCTYAQKTDPIQEGHLVS